jgi:hypothetical protein
MTSEILKRGINRILDDCCTRIKRQSLWTYGGNDWEIIKSSLEEWEKRDI